MTVPSPGFGSLIAAVRDSRLVDLTLPLAEDLPCTWPGHMPYQHKTFTWFAGAETAWARVHDRTGAGYQTRWLCLDEHTGTHLDAPMHFVPPPGSGLPHAGTFGDVGVADVPLDQAVGEAAVIDVTDLAGQGEPGCSPRITAARIRAWEDASGPISPGDVVLLRSDWDRHYRPGAEGRRYSQGPLVDRDTPGWPAPDVDAIELLLERGVRCVGTDGVSMGPADQGAPTHLAGLSRGQVFIEALGQLRELPARGALFMFFGLRLIEGTGGPGRALALIPPA